MPFSHTDEFEWHEPPGHLAGYSKYLVNPEGAGSRYFDFRLSSYPTGGRVDPHVHQVAEQVYYIIAGTGRAECGSEAADLGPGSVMFVPAGARHSFLATSAENLVFVVVTSPPGDIAR
jgi:mannose-6-phosphate isomerase-like protein (cupin superfamily)